MPTSRSASVPAASAPPSRFAPDMPIPGAIGPDGLAGQPAAPSGVMDRTLAILEVLAGSAEGLSITVLAEQLQLPLSAAHRLLAGLAERGYVRQGGGHVYQLTTRLVSLALRHMAASGITDLAQPILDRLARSTGELVRLAVADGDRLTWVAKSQGAQGGLRYDPDSGADAQLSCSSAGLAWLATMPDEEAVARVQRQGFGRRQEFGPKAPETPKALLQYVRAARRRGYSLGIQIFTPWMAAIAAPIVDPRTGAARGTVSIAGPLTRLPEAHIQTLAPLLLSAAAELADATPGSPALRNAATGRHNIFDAR